MSSPPVASGLTGLYEEHRAGILRYLTEIRQCNRRVWDSVANWRYADPIYGCESVCGGSPMG